ncbi:MAG TPA: DMT family transporter [Blastocatellia bacterium]|nr:DMT family transporter [Blastocatellia bacterium]
MFGSLLRRLFAAYLRSSWRGSHSRWRLYRALADAQPGGEFGKVLRRLAEFEHRRTLRLTRRLRQRQIPLPGDEFLLAKVWRWLLIRCGSRWAMAWIALTVTSEAIRGSIALHTALVIIRMKKMNTHGTQPSGVSYAIAAAALFGASTPFAKLLLGRVEPVPLASLLYLGSGVGLSCWLALRQRFNGTVASEANLVWSDWTSLAGAIFFGGVIGPVALLFGLAHTPASTASLLLNLEGVFTAALAWFVFRENFDRRIALGMAAITAGGVLLSWAERPQFGVPWGALAVAGACLAWGIDNNLTRKVSGGDPLLVAAAKGLVAGGVNLLLAQAIGAAWPRTPVILAAALVGLLGYGVSLTLFVLALRHIGTARTGAYFSLAPFVGGALSLPLLRERLTIYFPAAAALMGLGVWLHLTERHAHDHRHEAMTHDHRHVHDEHHRHEHDRFVPAGEPHSHPHRHETLVHSHLHYPDIHHRHQH